MRFEHGGADGARREVGSGRSSSRSARRTRWGAARPRDERSGSRTARSTPRAADLRGAGDGAFHVAYERPLADRNEEFDDLHRPGCGPLGRLLYEGKWFDPEAVAIKEGLTRGVASTAGRARLLIEPRREISTRSSRPDVAYLGQGGREPPGWRRPPAPSRRRTGSAPWRSRGSRCSSNLRSALQLAGCRRGCGSHLASHRGDRGGREALFWQHGDPSRVSVIRGREPSLPREPSGARHGHAFARFSPASPRSISCGGAPFPRDPVRVSKKCLRCFRSTSAQRTEARFAEAPKLDAFFAELQKKDEIPGLAVGLVVDGDLVWSKGYGARDCDAERSGRSWISQVLDRKSITKTFTAVAALQLRDEGKLVCSMRQHTGVRLFKWAEWGIR